MLKEFIEGRRNPPPSDVDEYLGRTVEAFDACVDFLRDPSRFPNIEVNKVAALMWRLIGNREIPLAQDQWGLPSMSFAVLGNAVDQIPLFILPEGFLKQVSEDPVYQLGMMAYMGSQGKDYYSGRVGKDSSDVINRRARAYEADALLTVQEMARQEGVDVVLQRYQQQLLAENPSGLTSLPSGFMYPTPVYIHPVGNPSLN